MKHQPNEYPSDAAEIAILVRKADDITAVRILQVWGAKQRDIGSIKGIQDFAERINAKA